MRSHSRAGKLAVAAVSALVLFAIPAAYGADPESKPVDDGEKQQGEVVARDDREGVAASRSRQRKNRWHETDPDFRLLRYHPDNDDDLVENYIHPDEEDGLFADNRSVRKRTRNINIRVDYDARLERLENGRWRRIGSARLRRNQAIVKRLKPGTYSLSYRVLLRARGMKKTMMFENRRAWPQPRQFELSKDPFFGTAGPASLRSGGQGPESQEDGLAPNTPSDPVRRSAMLDEESEPEGTFLTYTAEYCADGGTPPECSGNRNWNRRKNWRVRKVQDEEYPVPEAPPNEQNLLWLNFKSDGNCDVEDGYRMVNVVGTDSIAEAALLHVARRPYHLYSEQPGTTLRIGYYEYSDEDCGADPDAGEDCVNPETLAVADNGTLKVSDLDLNVKGLVQIGSLPASDEGSLSGGAGTLLISPGVDVRSEQLEVDGDTVPTDDLRLEETNDFVQRSSDDESLVRLRGSATWDDPAEDSDFGVPWTVVGFYTRGRLELIEGGYLNTGNLVLGEVEASPGYRDKPSQGFVRLEGVGEEGGTLYYPTIQVTLNTFLGAQGYGEILVRDGGFLDTMNLRIGEEVTASGVLEVAGTAGARAEVHAGFFAAGRKGEAEVRIRDGGLLSTGDGYDVPTSFYDPSSAVIGWKRGSRGVVQVGDSGSLWQEAADIVVGFQGEGELDIFNGGRVESEYGLVGVDLHASGLLVVQGSGSEWDIEQDLHVGGNETGDGGAGTISLKRDGVVNVGDDLILHPNSTVRTKVTQQGTTHRVVVSDVAELAGAADVTVGEGYQPPLNAEFPLIEVGNSRQGTFTGHVDHAENPIFGHNDRCWTVSYSGGDGNDVVLYARGISACAERVQNQRTGTWYATLRDAYNAADPGDTLELKPGRYLDTGDMTKNIGMVTVGGGPAIIGD